LEALAATVFSMPWVLNRVSPTAAPPHGAASAPAAGTTLVTDGRVAFAADDGTCSAAAVAVMEEGIAEDAAGG